jgi:hypothetical protein
MLTDTRYDGKPLLRLLELYVLHAIGELPAAEEATLNAMAPKLRALYGGAGPWYEAVAASVHLSDDMPDTIRGMWQKNSDIARANHVTLTPQKFAEMFVDDNFAS